MSDYGACTDMMHEFTGSLTCQCGAMLLPGDYYAKLWAEMPTHVRDKLRRIEMPAVRIEYPDHGTKFRRLVDWWRDDTMDISSLTDKVAHPAYLRIIGMGEAAVPLILRELRDRGGWWYSALTAITEAEPVPVADLGSVDRMTALWLGWGHAKGLI